MTSSRQIYTGIGLALLTVIIWSGNFVVARSVIRQISPVTLAFFRWATASVIILPFAWQYCRRDWPAIRQSATYLLLTALFGITLFNTFIYAGGHYTTAINLALVGTTASPIIALVLARIFLKEKIGWFKLTGLILCIAGVLFLLSQGSWDRLRHFHFTTGDKWVLLGALCFAIYTVLVRKKPKAISGVSFVCVLFCMGTLLLLPAYLWEAQHAAPVVWDTDLALIILYLGLGASVICYLCWNIAIRHLGAGRTALFGNLIPIFSSAEAALLLGEKFTWLHVVSMVLVFSGILIANIKAGK
ncbi:MAG TPA: DMT family transporter [Chitinophagaceae bacterium]|nr:DMT family transporter [Chitinophagaceae bacterium]